MDRGGGLTAPFFVGLFRCLFGGGGKPSGGGRRLDAKRPERAGPEAFGPGPRSFVWQAGRGPQGRPPRPPSPAAPACPPRPSCAPRATAVLPPDERCQRGRVVAVGYAEGGGGVLRARRARKTNAGAGPRAPAPALRALHAPAAPPGTLDFYRPFGRNTRSSAPKPTHKASAPAPMGGAPAYSVGKPKKFSSWFSPAFLKAGQRVWGAGSPPPGCEAEAQ